MHIFELCLTAGGNNHDYLRNTVTINIPPKQMSALFPVQIIDDNIAECDETFTLTLSVLSSYCGVISESDDTSEVMIRDDDGRRSVSVNVSLHSVMLSPIICTENNVDL